MTARGSGNRLLAAGALCAGVFVLSLQDIILKGLSGDYGVTQAMAMRSITALPALLVLVALRAGGLRSLVSRRLGTHLLRSAIMMAAYTCYYLALPAMKLAEVVTLFFTAPLFITALAYPMLGERIEARQLLAVTAGFIGVVVTYRPGVGIFDWASLLPVAAALCYALSQNMARQIGGTESATVMAFYQNLVYLLGALALAGVFAAAGIRAEGLHPSLAFLVRPWTFAHPGDIGLLLVCGPIAAVGTVFLSHAYRIARANFAAPFEYTGLIWAACWGYFFFGETPDPYMIAGAALIIGAGLTMLGSGRKG